MANKRNRPTRALSERELRLKQLLLDGHGFTEAMLRAGYARSTAETQTRRTREKPAIRRAIVAARILKGLYVTAEERDLLEN